MAKDKQRFPCPGCQAELETISTPARCNKEHYFTVSGGLLGPGVILFTLTSMEEEISGHRKESPEVEFRFDGTGDCPSCRERLELFPFLTAYCGHGHIFMYVRPYDKENENLICKIQSIRDTAECPIDTTYKVRYSSHLGWVLIDEDM